MLTYTSVALHRPLLTNYSLTSLLQSRCIGHYFSGEMASGGAAYIPTGRSLAIARQPWALLCASFATQCFYPGLDLAILLCGIPLVGPQVEVGLLAYIFASS